MRTVIAGLMIAAVAWAAAAGSLELRAKDSPSVDASQVIARLKPYQNLVGEWRGIGQPRRGSNQGAWQETVASAWQIRGEHPGIAWTVTEGKLWKSALLTTGDDRSPFVLRAQIDDQTERVYHGKTDADRLVLESPADAAGIVHRLTVTWLSSDRVVFLAEKRPAQQTFYQRVAEVAYQRQGTRLAAKDGGGPECVVTGGVGTIEVKYEGKTYYVCCTGCRDAFNDDPKGILAEYVERKKQEAEKKK